MKTLCFYIVLICSVYSSAQTITWALNANGSSADVSQGGICTDNSGNVYITSPYSSSVITLGTYTLYNNSTQSNNNFFLAKYNAAGNIQWAISGGGAALDESYSASCDPAGNVLITGRTTSSVITVAGGTFVIGSGMHIFVMKFSSTGSPLWLKTSNGYVGCQNIAYSISTDSNSNVYICGVSTATSLTFDAFTVYNPGVAPFAAKFDSSGNTLWLKNMISPGVASSVAWGIAADAVGNAFVTGMFGNSQLDFGTYTLTNNGNTDAFLAKYDPTGNLLWATNPNCVSDDVSNSVTTDDAGNSYITGFYNTNPISFGTYTLNNPSGTQRLFTCKYGPGGNSLWAISTGGNNPAIGRDIFSKGGRLYMCGSYSSVNSFGSYTLGSQPGWPDPMFVAILDLNGNPLYASALGSGGNSRSGICADETCKAYILSSFVPYLNNPNFVVGSNTLTNTGLEDIFVAQLVSPQPTVSIMPSTTLICAGAQASLVATGANTYSWSFGGTGTTSVISPTASAIYTVTGIAVNGCQNTAITTVSVMQCDGFAENFDDYSFGVFPNPSHAEFTITGIDELNSVHIYNLLGQEVEFIPFSKGEGLSLPTGAFAQVGVRLDQPNGIYFVKIGVVTKKIIKE